MYQELLPEGRVHYETGAGTGLIEFMAQGLPVNNTLELPLMPTLRVSVGDTWTTPGQRLDIPGLPPALQPIATLQNKLVDLEYEGGYPCVKIHQTFSGALSNLLSALTHDKFKALPFSGMLITSPTVTYDRDIYIAFNSGTLVRTARTLLIKGRTTASVAAPQTGASGGGLPGGLPSGMRGSGKGMGPNSGGGGDSMPGGGVVGGPNKGGARGGGMMPGGAGMSPPGGAGKGGMMGPGGAGSGGGMRPGGVGGPGGMRPGGVGGSSPFGGAGYNGGGEETDHPITIRSTADTDILSQTGATAPKAAVRQASSVTTKKTKKTTGK